MRGVRAGAAAIACAALVVGGCHCSSSPDPTASPVRAAASARHGAPVDVTFLETIVFQHQQALELAAMVPEQTSNTALIKLAAQIAAQQFREQQGCAAQLLQWETPAAQHAAADTIPGMADAATIDRLRALHGPEFDTAWLQVMLAHHRGAISLAHDEIEHGQSPEAISIAQSLIPLQQTQIDQINELLGVR